MNREPTIHALVISGRGLGAVQYSPQNARHSFPPTSFIYTGCTKNETIYKRIRSNICSGVSSNQKFGAVWGHHKCKRQNSSVWYYVGSSDFYFTNIIYKIYLNDLQLSCVSRWKADGLYVCKPSWRQNSAATKRMRINVLRLCCQLSFTVHGLLVKIGLSVHQRLFPKICSVFIWIKTDVSNGVSFKVFPQNRWNCTSSLLVMTLDFVSNFTFFLKSTIIADHRGKTPNLDHLKKFHIRISFVIVNDTMY